jgi:hypothetical protein
VGRTSASILETIGILRVVATWGKKITSGLVLIGKIPSAAYPRLEGVRRLPFDRVIMPLMK